MEFLSHLLASGQRMFSAYLTFFSCVHLLANRKFLAKGYKVGRVDQAETALGAEMRLAADKKGAKKAPQADKIVRR